MSYLTRSVLAQLLLGALLKALLPQSAALEEFLSWTTFSVIGLFLGVGLQLEKRSFSEDLRIVSVLVGVTTVVPFVVFVLTALLFGVELFPALTLSVVLITTGTGVTIQTLANLGLLQTRAGTFLTLVSALDDVPAALLMSLLLFSAPLPQVEGSLFRGNSAFVALVALLALALVSKLQFRFRSPAASVLALSFGVALALTLERLHISLVMGGLAAGVLLGALFSSFRSELQTHLDKLLRPFLLLYMVSIGMKLSPGVFTGSWALGFSLVLSVVAVLTKYGTAAWVLRKRADLDPPLVSWGLVPRGIPGFAFASTAVSQGLIGAELFTILILVVSVTTWVGLAGLEVVGRPKV